VVLLETAVDQYDRSAGAFEAEGRMKLTLSPFILRPNNKVRKFSTNQDYHELKIVDIKFAAPPRIGVRPEFFKIP
jgi:hypothetical protein